MLHPCMSSLTPTHHGSSMSSSYAYPYRVQSLSYLYNLVCIVEATPSLESREGNKVTSTIILWWDHVIVSIHVDA